MLRCKLKKLIIGILLVCSLLFGGVFVKADTNKYLSTGAEVNQQITVNKGKILIYHSHTLEKNVNSTVVQIGEDLSIKLRKKGYVVEHILNNFSKNYNKAYYNSREMLESKNLNDYILIIDLHIDSGEKPFITNVNDKEVAKIMFVQATESPNIEKGLQNAKGVMNELNKFGKDISRDIWDKYRRGITYFNQDINENVVLIEIGNNKCDELQSKRANTYLAASIDNYFK